jgi:hypothetical protein
MGIYSNKCSEGLDHFYVWSPCNFLIEYYTMMFYAIYKWNVPSIWCKKRLGWSNSMREVDCPNLVHIDFNVPMLTPGHGVFWECSPPWALSSAKGARLLKARVTWRLMVGQSVTLGVEPHEILITVWQLQSCFCEAPLWREDGSVFCICCWSLPAVFLGSESLGTCDNILLSQFLDFPFQCLLRLAGSRYMYSTLPPHRYAAGDILII